MKIENTLTKRKRVYQFLCKELLFDGLSPRRIAEVLGLRPSTVKRYLHHQKLLDGGWDGTVHDIWSEVCARKVHMLYRIGYSMGNIGEMFGHNQPWASKMVRKKGRGMPLIVLETQRTVRGQRDNLSFPPGRYFLAMSETDELVLTEGENDKVDGVCPEDLIVNTTIITIDHKIYALQGAIYERSKQAA